MLEQIVAMVIVFQVVTLFGLAWILNVLLRMETDATTARQRPPDINDADWWKRGEHRGYDSEE